MHAVIRADASPAIGGGHVVRSLALAAAMEKLGWHCELAARADTGHTIPSLDDSAVHFIKLGEFEANDPAHLGLRWRDGIDLLIVDHFDLGADFETGSKQWADCVMAIDGQRRPHDCDFLLDPNLGRAREEFESLVPERCHLLLGPEFALLRPQFLELRERSLARRDGSLQRILVMLGATDFGGLTPVVLEAIAAVNQTAHVHIVVGPKVNWDRDFEMKSRRWPFPVTRHVWPANIAELMCETDLFIGACGSTVWECCCLGIPSLFLEVAKDQRSNGEALGSRGAAKILEVPQQGAGKNLVFAISEMLHDVLLRLRLGRNASALCDGEGAVRAAAILTAAIDTNPRRRVRIS